MDIKSFKINKLHGTLDFELTFHDNTLILLGENGSCKTTIIKMLYYTLSLQWLNLTRYDFESVELFIDKIIKIKRDDIVKLINSPHDDRMLPSFIRRRVMDIIEREGSNSPKIEELCRQYGLPIEVIEQVFNIDFIQGRSGQRRENPLMKSKQYLKEKLENVHIFYLPTYRRIEQDLKEVLEGEIGEYDFIGNRRNLRTQENNNYTELIKFGMDDVGDAINNTLRDLKDSSRASLNKLTLGYLGDIVDKEYKNADINKISAIDDEIINQIMNRVDDNILSESSKNNLLKALQSIKNNGGISEVHDQVVCHYFLKLYESHQELTKKETSIRAFIDVCNRYLENKQMKYDSPSFSFSIISNYDEHVIKLNQLSSGEKQIVSMFSHLYLSNKNKCLVLIDEPELSLSVKWQKTFLEDVKKGELCKGLVAVTHSPFVFDNSLEKYAHGIEEFRM